MALVTCGLLAFGAAHHYADQQNCRQARLTTKSVRKIELLPRTRKNQRRTGNNGLWQRQQYLYQKNFGYTDKKKASGGWQVGLRVGFNHQNHRLGQRHSAFGRRVRLTWKRTSRICPKISKNLQIRQAHYHAGPAWTTKRALNYPLYIGSDRIWSIDEKTPSQIYEPGTVTCLQTLWNSAGGLYRGAH